MLTKQNQYQPKQQNNPTYNNQYNKLIQQVNQINGQKLIRHPQQQDQDINKMNKLKFIGANTNKYYEVPNSNSNKRINKDDQSRVSVIKFYQLFPKQPSRITFGPNNFKNNGQKQFQYKINNPQYILPITHKHNKLSKVSKSSSNVQNLKIKPKIYNIVHRQLGLSQQKISRMREDALNYQLQRYLKKKGLQYLQQNRQKNRRVHTQVQQKSHSISQHHQINQKHKKIIVQKYRNYIPEVFPKIQRNKKNQKDIKSVQKDSLKIEKTKNRKKAQSKQQLKIDLLNQKQQILGKQVYDKVQDYFQLHKQKVNYFVRVKSEQKIDQALIQYLKTKVDRADLILNTKKDKKHSLLLFKNN